jgi:hypothetical protein
MILELSLEASSHLSLISKHYIGGGEGLLFPTMSFQEQPQIEIPPPPYADVSMHAEFPPSNIQRLNPANKWNKCSTPMLLQLNNTNQPLMAVEYGHLLAVFTLSISGQSYL